MRILTYAENVVDRQVFPWAPIGKPPSATGQLIPDNGGPDSLVQLSRRLNTPDQFGISRAAIWSVFDPSQEKFTPADIVAGAQKLGLELKAVKISLSKLEDWNVPALLFLADEGRFVTLTAIDAQQAVIVDRGVTQILRRGTLEEAYSGDAILAATDAESASLRMDDPVQEIQLQSLDETVKREVPIHNIGKAPLHLQLEDPIPGAAAQLSTTTVAPGETASVHLKLQWRPVLHSPIQNILVNVTADDPARPRLQLAFRLSPPLDQK
jgi:hypothetical protein